MLHTHTHTHTHLHIHICIYSHTQVPLILVDSKVYGRFVFAPLNILLYNVFGGGGPNLYGTEPWTYYFVNGFLNFNVVFLLALGAWPYIEIKVRVCTCTLIHCISAVGLCWVRSVITSVVGCIEECI